MTAVEYIVKELTELGFFSDSKMIKCDFIIKQAKEMEKEHIISNVLSDTNYWKQRCLLAERCLEDIARDPDITQYQIKAFNNYHNFIGSNGNDR